MKFILDDDKLENKFQDLEYRIDNNEDRIINLEVQEKKYEGYKFHLQPQNIKNFINNVINLQSKEEGNYQFYPCGVTTIQDYFSDHQFNPGSINPNKIKYTSSFSENEINQISKLVSYQGKSGYNFLLNVESNIDLNKPLTLYYGILHLSVFFSNLFYNFTDFNRTLSSFPQIKSHGLDTTKINKIEFDNTTEEILLTPLKFKKTGIPFRFLIPYKSYSLKYLINEEEINLLDLLKNYFWESNVKTKFLHNFDKSTPKIKLDKAFSIYLLSYYFSVLSRYKMATWNRLISDDGSNINYFIRYFLKFSKNEFITSIFDRIESERYGIPRKTRLSFFLRV